MNKRNFFSSLAVLVIFAFFYVYVLQLKAEAKYWPELICIAGAALSLLNALLAGLKWHREKDGGKVFPGTKDEVLRSLMLLGVTALWIFLIPRLGYLVSTVLATAGLVWIFEPQKSKQTLLRDMIATAVFTGAVFGLFSLLGVHFPKGILI